MREGVVEALGEPDDIESGGSGVYKYELYYYLNKDLNRVYEFRKSASGCGTEGNWYVESIWYADYHFNRDLYEAPEIEHEEIESAVSGQALKITAIVTDDEHVTSVDLFYKSIDDPDSLLVTKNMAVADSIYSTTLPASVMVPPGIDYYIKATDNDDHSSRVPSANNDYYTIKISEDSVDKIAPANKAINLKKKTADELLPDTLFDGNSPTGP